MLFTIIIPLYNSNYTKKQIKSIYSLDLSDNIFVDIFFVDDGSSEEYKKIYLKNFQIKKINNNININYIELWEKKWENRVSKARNLWAKLSKSDNLIFIDQDTILYKDYIKNLIKIINNNDIIIWSYLWYNNFEKNLNNIDINFFIDNWYINKKNFDDFRINFYKDKTKKWRIWEFFAASNFFIKKDIFDKIWWFDEQIITWGDEDVEFWYRLFKSWFNIVFNPDYKVLNLSEKLYTKKPSIIENNKVFYLSNNWLKNLKKHNSNQYLNYVLDRYNNLNIEHKNLVSNKFKKFLEWICKIY